ncbi:hypothetical protein ES288_A05G387200v1 [Gossypium darwinii]|uniref:Uncharacterized protein n=1 Tax=Gossypium darwinii TaxID=34276 RepID=A0A5D2GP59_GOSDA|nr:hypothetical protein ES288_A05G387200v1 [Gossypium darwinii]
MACKHALASAMIGSEIFSHGKLNEASKFTFIVPFSGGFHSELSTTCTCLNKTSSAFISMQ